MAQKENWMRCRNAPISVNTSFPRLLSYRFLSLQTIKKWTPSIGAIKIIPMGMGFLFWFCVVLILFLLQRRPTSAITSSAASSLSPSRIVLLAMYHVQSGHVDTRSLIQVMEHLMWSSNSSEPMSSFLLMRMALTISPTPFLSILSFLCVGNQPFPCRIPIDSGTCWPTATPAFLAQRQLW